MKKHIANVITGSRAIFSLPLVFIPLSSVWFYALYLFCGLTDMIDGTVARKTGSISTFGEKLDTVSGELRVCMLTLNQVFVKAFTLYINVNGCVAVNKEK